MKNFLTAYLVTGLIFLILDALWLGLIANNFYRSQLGDLMLENTKFGIATMFYLFYVIGLVVFAVQPALAAQNIALAAGYAALFGFLAYGTYDFTNMATLKDWPVMMSVVDIIWGTALSATSATLGYLFISKFL